VAAGGGRDRSVALYLLLTRVIGADGHPRLIIRDNTGEVRRLKETQIRGVHIPELVKILAVGVEISDPIIILALAMTSSRSTNNINTTIPISVGYGSST
jgi:hypothetical protein